MSNCFEDLRSLGKKIDEGIELLEAKLSNPYSLGVVTTKSAALCEKTIGNLENEMTNLLENIQLQTKEEAEDLEEIQSDIETVNDFIRGLLNDINSVESSLANNPDYIPFSKPMQNNISSGNSAIEEGSVNNLVLKDLTNSENLIGSESPNFVSPNYNSTPEPNTCSRNKKVGGTPFDRIWQKHTNQPGDISRLSEITFRLDTPSNLSRLPNKSYLRKHTEPPRIPVMLSGRDTKKDIASPKEPECSFRISSHQQRNFRKYTTNNQE